VVSSGFWFNVAAKLNVVNGRPPGISYTSFPLPATGSTRMGWVVPSVTAAASKILRYAMLLEPLIIFTEYNEPGVVVTFEMTVVVVADSLMIL